MFYLCSAVAVDGATREQQRGGDGRPVWSRLERDLRAQSQLHRLLHSEKCHLAVPWILQHTEYTRGQYWTGKEILQMCFKVRMYEAVIPALHILVNIFVLQHVVICV